MTLTAVSVNNDSQTIARPSRFFGRGVNGSTVPHSLREMPKRPPKRIEASELAAVLSYGDLHGDKAAAEKFGVSLRTLQRRRAEVRDGKNDKLAALVVGAKSKAVAGREALLAETYGAALERLRDLLPGADFDQTVSAVKVVGDLQLATDALNDDEDDESTGNFGARAATQGGASTNSPRATH